MALTQKDLSAIRGVMREEIAPVKKDISSLKKGIARIEKKFSELFDFLDKKYLEVKRDVRVIQKHLHLTVSDF